MLRSRPRVEAVVRLSCCQVEVSDSARGPGVASQEGLLRRSFRCSCSRGGRIPQSSAPVPKCGLVIAVLHRLTFFVALGKREPMHRPGGLLSGGARTYAGLLRTRRYGKRRAATKRVAFRRFWCMLSWLVCSGRRPGACFRVTFKRGGGRGRGGLPLRSKTR